MTNLPSSNSPIEWMSAIFEQFEVDSCHYPAFVRFFQSELDVIERDYQVDAVADRTTLLDPDEPFSGTCHQVVAENVVNVFEQYLTSVNEGHSPGWAEVFAPEFVREEREEYASAKAYDKIRLSGISSPDDPAYQDAYQACIRQGWSEDDARPCAEFIFDYDFSFQRAKNAAEQYARTEKECLARGYSSTRARIYAEVLLWNEYSTFYVEIYARTVEERMADGYSENDARKFASAYVEHHSLCGSNDEERIDPYVAAFAEADFRWRANYGDKKAFGNAFASICHSLPWQKGQSLKAMYDEVENRTRNSRT